MESCENGRIERSSCYCERIYGAGTGGNFSDREYSERRLKSGGRLGVITFQSLEDRIIKQTFRYMERDCVCPPELPVCVCHHHKEVRQVVKALKPSAEELKENPRARSAILRVVEKI